MPRNWFFAGIIGISLIVGFVSWPIFSTGHQKTIKLGQAVKTTHSSLNKSKADSNTNNSSGTPKDKSTAIASQTKAMGLEDWKTQINQWVSEFPFPQENTQSIPGANPPDVAKAITDFAEKIDRQIYMNPKLSREDKARILWDVYQGNEWPGDNNALREIIGGVLAGLAPYELSPEIADAYQNLLPQGGQSRQARHDLLEIAHSILTIGKEQIANNSQAESVYQANVPYIKEMLRQQILHTNDASFFDLSDETSGLMEFSMELYGNQANQTELESLIPEIKADINDRPEFSAQMYSAVFRSLFANSDKSLTSVNSLLTSPDTETQEGMNSALSFLLKEEGNVNLSALPQEMRSSLVNYFQSQNNAVQGSDYAADWRIAFERLK
ncbi:hypothetical protein [Methyloglobulus sp.]|uniref:hypothetical protein n=1 Tax=Methyloglobulus sp. TaxID=2518622 RepID=UPI0032B83C9A